MLTGRYEAIPGEGENTIPDTWHTATDSFKAAFYTPFLLTPQSSADREELKQSIDVMQSVANTGDQGLGQKTMNWFAGFAGGVVNPYSIATGELLGGVASGAIAGAAGLIGRYAPFEATLAATVIGSKRLGSMAIAENAPKFVANKTVSDLVKGSVSGFAIGTGFSLPQALAEKYDAKQDAFNWWGGVKTSFADGGIGLGLMAVPYLGGILWGRIARRAGEELSHAESPMPHEGKVPEAKPGEVQKESTHPALGQIEAAEQSGRLDKESAQWYRDYVKGSVSNEELNERAISLLIRDGHPVNAATKRVLLKLFQPEEIDRLQTALADELASQTPSSIKPLLREFMMNVKVDELRGNTKMLDGIQGVTEFINRRLSFLPEEMINFNKIIRRFLPESKREENIFTQYKIYQSEKINKSTGATIPEHVEQLLNHDKQLRELQNKINNYEREYKKTGKEKFERWRKNNVEKLIDLEKSRPNLLSHPEEMNYLRDKLMPEGIVRDNFKFTREYERLSDLTRVRNDARQLMQELHVRDEYQKHADYATVLDTITKVMRSSVGRLANADNVINYMKERVVREIPDIERMENLETRLENESEGINKRVTEELADKAQEKRTFSDELVDSFNEEMREAPSEIRQEFDSVKNQFKEFNEQQGVFNNLIKCLQGTING